MLIFSCDDGIGCGIDGVIGGSDGGGGSYGSGYGYGSSYIDLMN